MTKKLSENENRQKSLVNEVVSKVGTPRLIIGIFFLITLVMSCFLDISLPMTLSDIIKRIGMNGVLVLAMVPSIQAGMGPNFALPLGICCGLLGMVISIEIGMLGLGFLIVAMIIATVIAVIVGILYGKLLNSIKGSEMAIATYTGFAAVAVMCLVWLMLPFQSPNMKWFLGDGLRETIQLENIGADGLFNDFLRITIGNFTVPTGLLLVLGLFCFLIWMFFKSKSGMAVVACGKSNKFAVASGMDINKNRIIGNILSTVLGAVGIIIYAQSYGFVQLYTAPLMMAFPAVAGILIGGATPNAAKVSHVFIGTLLFQGLLASALPVANVVFAGTDLSEMIRMVIQNGIILYALCQVKGGARS